MTPITINARDYCETGQSVVSSAEMVAAEVVDRLGGDELVRVSMQGVPGAASSFFNVILLAVAAERGEEAILSRLRFEFSSKMQEALYGRSLDAVLRQAK